MAHALNTTAALNGLGLIDRARTVISQYRTYRQTLTELQSLSARDLADLGLTRSNLRDVARESAYGF
ncbi:MAG: DUF1127 domain-containing protein [Amaricoccus sp.]|uniref:DUF1127 domain-containing protein n=1 Tax=Amaricoccus sp. TaxID=1872485 RepID=UPI0039E23234